MKKWMILGALLLLLLPQRGTDVGKLLPVETLLIEKRAGMYVLSADTGDTASGESLKTAVENLQRSAPGEIFLDTADYVLLTRETIGCIGELSLFVRPGTQVYVAEQNVQFEEIGEFLRTHGPKAPLYRVKKGEIEIPTLCAEGGERYFEGK